MELNDDLILQWEPKIQKMVSNTFILGLDREDLAQELRIGLVKAAKAFNESRGISFHTYLHTSLVNATRTLITKAQKQPQTRSIEFKFNDSEIIPTEIANALTDTKNNYEETDINILIDTVNLLDKEKYFIRLKLEGMTMEEITEDLGENAYKIRHSIRQKIEDIFIEQLEKSDA